MFSDDDGSSARVGVRIGDSVLDLARALGDEVFGEPSLNAFMAQGRSRWTEVRARITELLTGTQPGERPRGATETALLPLAAVRLHLPFTPGDYVDFYSGIIYQAMGFPMTMFPVLFAIGRMPGWLAHWQEGSIDKEQKIARPDRKSVV